MSITDSKCKTFSLQYSYMASDLGFPHLVQHLHNCCIVSLTPMCAGQTTYVIQTKPRLASLFRLCTASLKIFMRVTIEKQMKMQYIKRIIDCTVDSRYYIDRLLCYISYYVGISKHQTISYINLYKLFLLYVVQKC